MVLFPSSSNFTIIIVQGSMELVAIQILFQVPSIKKNVFLISIHFFLLKHIKMTKQLH